MVPPLIQGEERNSSIPPSGVRSSEARHPGHKTIVVVGHGMVGQRFCEEVRSRRTLRRMKVVVFGEEPQLAYDRVHLCEILRGQKHEGIQLVHDHWYDENRVELVRRDPIVDLNREEKWVRSANGRIQHYEHLVLATGATPFLAKIPGIDGPRIQTLRTANDASKILEAALSSTRAGLPVVIIGGGLLGTELAYELVQLGVEVTILESADFPLSRQLERSAGTLLHAQLERAGIPIQTKVRVLSLDDNGDACVVRMHDNEPIRAGLVVPAMGIRPRDQIARAAGIRCDMFGGIEVDDDLLTSDPAISAIGECARHKGMSYGLVAPGYAMAEAVARRLAGGESKFGGVQIGTRLKVPGVELTVVGESQATGLGLRSHVFQADGVHRRLALKRGRVIGITSVGDWDDLPRAQDAMARAEKLEPRQLERFRRNEPMWTGGKLSLHAWPDSATVCNCMGVTCGALRRAQREGCANVEALALATGASTICGSCRPLLSTLTDPKPEEPDEPSGWMVRLSLLSLIGALVFLFIPAVPYSDSVQAESIDFLWRSGETKQITGFTLAGLFALSIIFSMRKRLSWLRWGDFEAWRVTHASLGVVCLVGGFAHTGFRLGSNLDFALVLVFLGSTLLGGLAGGWGLVESRLSTERGRNSRALLIRSHIYLLWPLPVLLLAHIAKVYFF